VRVQLRRFADIKLLIVLFILCFCLTAVSQAASEPFPLYPCIQPNVEFWKKIYSEYSTSQGVLHDSLDLSIIYGVIELEDPDHSGARRINRKRIKSAKHRYERILSKLARGLPPKGAIEQSVADLFGPQAKKSDYRRAIRNIRCQVGQKDRFRAGVIRSGAYLDEIKKILRKHAVPEDLVFLPHVESSFNPNAYSKFGAAGVWQFTRSTGRRYMKIGYDVDERRDPIISSHAAARLLKDNYEKFKNWPMAITAYNHGASGMLRAKRQKGTYEAIFKEYRSRIFKFASRNFYSEFLAAREVAKNYRHHFGDLTLDKPLKRLEIELAGYISLPDVARELEIDLDLLRHLNPALRQPVFKGQKYVPKGYRLRLPASDERDYAAALAEISQKLFKHAQKHSQFYTVQRGDTAGKIARMHAVPLKDLIALNNLDHRATIYVDQNLRIPPPEEKSSPTVAEAPAQRPSASEQQSGLLADSTRHSAETKETIESPQLRAKQTDVQSHRPTPESDLSPDRDHTLADGRPVDIAISPDIIVGKLGVQQTVTAGGSSVGIISVEVEETLGHYAEWAEVSAAEIRRLNGFVYGRHIYFSQVVKIPLNRVSGQEFEERRYLYHKLLAEDFFSSFRIENVQTYTIKRGDNIWNLSREEFEVPLWLIRRYNAAVDLNALMPSQKLRVPIVEKIA
jgi:membrane-bound lytic murein transglycosylase D